MTDVAKLLAKANVMALVLPFKEAASVVVSGDARRQVWQVPLYANSVYLMASSVATAGLGFIFWLVVARLYAPEDVGLGSALISAATLLGFVASLGLGVGLIRYLPGAGSGASALINSCLTFSCLAAIAVAGIFLAGVPAWAPALMFVREDAAFVSVFIALVVASAMSGLLDGVFVGMRCADFVLARGVVFSILKIALAIAFASLLAVFGIVAAWCVGLAVAGALGLLVFVPRALPGYRLVPTTRRHSTGEMITFSLVNYAATGLWSAPAWLLPIVVVNLLGGEANAYFYMAWGLAGLLFAIPLSVSTSLLSEGSHDEGHLARDVRRSLKLVGILLLPAVALTLGLGDKMLLLFGREYSLEGARLLWVLVPSSLPVAVNLVYLGIARVRKRHKEVVLVSGGVALGTLILGCALIPPLGILGPAAGWLVSQSLIATVVGPSIMRVAKGY